jgi:type VI secretion protein, VC_A0107 family
MATSSQKFIQRNRAPRVQIEYDVELYGAEKKVQLPFVMGVMSDLSGNPKEALSPVADRKFVDISVDNFDDRLKAMKPRVAFQVPNTLTGEGNISVDLSFESLDEFSPAAIARKVGALNQLLQARNQLSNLVTYMDGRTGAEDLVANLLKDPALLQALAAAPKPDAGNESSGQDKSKDK